MQDRFHFDFILEDKQIHNNCDFNSSQAYVVARGFFLQPARAIFDPSSFHTVTRISQKHNIDHNNSYYVVSTFAKNFPSEKLDADIILMSTYIVFGEGGLNKVRCTLCVWFV